MRLLFRPLGGSFHIQKIPKNIQAAGECTSSIGRRLDLQNIKCRIFFFFVENFCLPGPDPQPQLNPETNSDPDSKLCFFILGIVLITLCQFMVLSCPDPMFSYHIFSFFSSLPGRDLNLKELYTMKTGRANNLATLYQCRLSSYHILFLFYRSLLS
jgi:hypothetical protein